jgi:hypothetical protein
VEEKERKEELEIKEVEAQSAVLSRTTDVPKHISGISTHKRFSEQNQKESASPQVWENKEICLHAKQVINLGNNRKLSVPNFFYVRLCELDGLTCANYGDPSLVEKCPTLDLWRTIQRR